MQTPPSRPRGGRAIRRSVAAALLCLLVVAPSLPPAGPVLLDVVSPEPGATVGLGGVELLVRFRMPGSAAESFRASLNGADVTDLLTTGENGTYGRLMGLLPGENVLRLVISGRAPWATSESFEQTRELRIRMRPPLDLDRG